MCSVLAQGAVDAESSQRLGHVQEQSLLRTEYTQACTHAARPVPHLPLTGILCQPVASARCLSALSLFFSLSKLSKELQTAAEDQRRL